MIKAMDEKLTARLRVISCTIRPQNNIEGVNTSNWPSALQPIRPIGNKGAEPLIINYQMGPEDTASAPTPIRQTPIKPAFPNPPARNR